MDLAGHLRLIPDLAANGCGLSIVDIVRGLVAPSSPGKRRSA